MSYSAPTHESSPDSTQSSCDQPMAMRVATERYHSALKFAQLCYFNALIDAIDLSTAFATGGVHMWRHRNASIDLLSSHNISTPSCAWWFSYFFQIEWQRCSLIHETMGWSSMLQRRLTYGNGVVDVNLCAFSGGWNESLLYTAAGHSLCDTAADDITAITAKLKTSCLVGHWALILH